MRPHFPASPVPGVHPWRRDHGHAPRQRPPPAALRVLAGAEGHGEHASLFRWLRWLALPVGLLNISPSSPVDQATVKLTRALEEEAATGHRPTHREPYRVRGTFSLGVSCCPASHPCLPLLLRRRGLPHNQSIDQSINQSIAIKSRHLSASPSRCLRGRASTRSTAWPTRWRTATATSS